MIIQLDFSQVNRTVAGYLREQIKNGAITKECLIALLKAFEGVTLPCDIEVISDKEVGYADIKEKVYGQDNYLWKVIARLEFWLIINDTTGNKIADKEDIRANAAVILGNYV